MYLSTRETGRLSYQASNSITLQNGFISEANALFTAEIVPDPDQLITGKELIESESNERSTA